MVWGVGWFTRGWQLAFFVRVPVRRVMLLLALLSAVLVHSSTAAATLLPHQADGILRHASYDVRMTLV